MSRPRCCRRIARVPTVLTYGPDEGSGAALDETAMSLDEFEAIRLADLEGLYHADAAAQMGVSRATFGRIVGSARGKLSDVLVNGKRLRIEGGAMYDEVRGRLWCRAGPDSPEGSVCLHRHQDCPFNKKE